MARRPRRPPEVSHRALADLYEREATRLTAPIFRAALAAIRSVQRRGVRADADDADSVSPEVLAALRARIIREATAAAARLAGEGPPIQAVTTRGRTAAEQSLRTAIRTLIAAGMGAEQIAGVLRVPTLADDIRRGVDLIDIAALPGGMESVTAWAEEGVSLISTRPAEVLQGVEEMVARTVREGVRYTTLEKDLRDRLAMSQRHARLVARDQVGKLQAAITRDTQRLAGVEEYVWRTVRDARVRARHRHLEGTRWSLLGPGAPEAGPYGQPAHPGEAIQCRCYAEPIIPDAPELARPDRPFAPDQMRSDLPGPRQPPGTIPRSIRPPGGRPAWALT